MLQLLMNTFFGCSHRRTTFPMTPTRKNGGFPAGVLVHSETYVVCLDCGKQFEYDLDRMQIGKPIDHSHEHAVVPPPRPASRGSKLVFGLLAAVPVAVVLGTAWRGKKKSAQRNEAENPASRDKARGATG